MSSIERVCKITGEKFYVSELEQNLRKKFGVGLPSISPTERMRHLMTFRNSVAMYSVICDLCKKPTLSMWGQKPAFPVYCNSCFQGDDWKPQEMDLDLDRPFFEQFHELVNVSPHPARTLTEPIENSDYCNACTEIRNCYMCFEVGLCENCYYSHRLQSGKNCVDTGMTLVGEFLYDSVACDDSYQVRWSEFAINCSDSIFLYDCADCDNCAFSSGLRHKSYVFRNEQLTKDEYQKKISELNTGSYSKLQGYIAEFKKMKAAYPKKYIAGMNNTNVTGNVIFNSKDVENSYDIRDAENISNAIQMWGAKDILDVDCFGYNSEMIYSSVAAGDSTLNLKFTVDCFNGNTDITYCYRIFSSHDCFGCCYSKHLEYRILNKAYTKEEYEKLRDALIAKMKERGEWDQMFTKELVPFAYNLSNAYINMPLTREQAEKLGYQWEERNIPTVPQDKLLVPADDINNVEWKDVEGKFVVCEESGRPFKIVKQEFDFYKQFNIPLPHLHPEVRLMKRYPRELFFNLHEATCSNCNKKITTSMPPEDKLLCDECYREKVI